MTEPEIPQDNLDGRHDPSAVGVVSVLACFALAALVAFAWTGNVLLTGGIVLAGVLLVGWLLR